jgi:hypothetical protein
MSHAPLRQEEDRIQTIKIVLIGVFALVAFVVGIYWAARIQRGVTSSIKSKVGPKPVGVGKLEVGMVYQPLFESVDIAHDHDAPLRARLQTYGWADASHQTARIPISRAMQLVVDRGKL